MEFIFELVLQILMIWPGAFIRWMAGGFRKPFNVYMDNAEINSLLGLIIIFALVMLIWFLTR